MVLNAWIFRYFEKIKEEDVIEIRLPKDVWKKHAKEYIEALQKRFELCDGRGMSCYRPDKDFLLENNRKEYLKCMSLINDTEISFGTPCMFVAQELPGHCIVQGWTDLFKYLEAEKSYYLLTKKMAGYKW